MVWLISSLTFRPLWAQVLNLAYVSFCSLIMLPWFFVPTRLTVFKSTEKTSIPGKSSWQSNDPCPSAEPFCILRLCTEIQKFVLGWVGFVEAAFEALLKYLSQFLSLDFSLRWIKAQQRCRRNKRKLQEWKRLRVIPQNIYPSKMTVNRWVKVYQAKAVTLGET